MADVRLACRWCVLAKGLKGSDLDALASTPEELAAHVELEHKIIVRRHGESVDDAKARYYRTYPERAEKADG